MANIIANQEVHAKYGGVVPELASRAHQQHILPVVHQALLQAGIALSDLHAIAYTNGPGLMGSLLVGASFARGLALSLQLPAYGIHHMRAHILAHFIADAHPAPPPFPFLCLTVSGGHTQLVRVDSPSDFALLGQTLDDAAGEAFDKAAKMLGLPYPGGPEIDRLAQNGDPHRFTFAKAQVGGLDFSFSGTKTSVLYELQRAQKDNPRFIEENLEDLCASIQLTIVDILMKRLQEAATQTGIRHIALAGGVSANSGLRNALQAQSEKLGWTPYVPPLRYCTDNAAMIGIAAAMDMERGKTAQELPILARSPLV